ncbi:MAG TPA: NusG domain II-containing protein [Candidatus Blautia faecipullorum]|nr:NusG domain II-containing protein [Candidatus Blautia faecipullorum]
METEIIKADGKIRISVNGEEYGVYSLEEEQTIKIGDTNVCIIKNGQCRMTEASCPEHLCIEQGAIDNRGGTIICLPNKVVIEVVEADRMSENGIDTVIR